MVLGGGGLFLMSEVPLYGFGARTRTNVQARVAAPLEGRCIAVVVYTIHFTHDSREGLNSPTREYQCEVHVSINVRLASMQHSRVVQVHSRFKFTSSSGQGFVSPLRWSIAGSSIK